MKLPLITNIQKYSIHDGTGIRTTVFFKGCPLSCVWCHNPETQRPEACIMTYQERCTGCGACEAVCPQKAIAVTEGRAVTDPVRCSACGACLDECLQNARELCGRAWSIEELVRELGKDQAFYETSGGGVTLSGGEVLAQDPDYLEELLKALHRRGIRVFMDTCGAVPFERMERVLPYTDTFLYDLKCMEEERHKQYMGVGNRQILQNLIHLSERGARIWIRIPVIGGVNDSKEEMLRIIGFLTEHHIQVQQVNLLPYHNTGSGKYQHLNRSYPGERLTVPTAEHMEEFRQCFVAAGFGHVLIGG